MAGEYYNWCDLGNVSGSVPIDPYSGPNINKWMTATGNVTLVVTTQADNPVQFKVRIVDGTGLGLLTFSVNITVLGVPLPALIDSDGELFLFDWDGNALWLLNS